MWIRIHLPLRFGAIRPILECIPWQWLALSAARGIDAEYDIHIVHHVTWGSLHVGSRLWKLRKPFVFGPVGGGQIAPRGFRRYLQGGWLLEMLRSFIVRYFTSVLFSAKSTVSHSNLVLAVNLDTHKWVQRLGGSRVELMLDIGIPRSMLADAEKSAKPGQALKVLWVGRLVPRKALLLALEALAQVDKTIDVTCTILGDGPQGQFLPGWIEQLGVGHRVEWRGQVAWEVVMQAYSDHDVFLFTSLRDTGGTQLVEAMAKGLAVVTLDHHGAHVAVPAEAGIKVPVTVPERVTREIAHALERLAKDPETVACMGRAARKCAENHTWDKKAARMSDIYPTLIAPFNQ